MTVLRVGGRFLAGALLGALLGVVGFALWLGITGWGMQGEFASFQTSVRQVQAAASSGDINSAAAVVPQAAEDAAALHATLSAAPWVWLQGFPIVGETVTAAATFAAAADSVLTPAVPVAQQAQVITSGSVAGAAATVPTVADDLSAAAAAAAQAAPSIAAIDPAEVLGPARGQVRTAQADFLEMAEALEVAAAGVTATSGLLGLEEPATWLVTLSQPAEARGSGGGFFGGYATVTASNGDLAITQSAANDGLTNTPNDLSGLPNEYRQLWGPDAEYLYAYNLTRHWPYAASVAHRAVDPAADFVVALDPAAVAALLQITGPVAAAGITIDSTTAIDFFTRGIYVQFPEPVQKDAVALQFLSAMFATLSASDPSPQALWQALAPVVDAQHLQIWSPDPAVQEQLERTPLAAAVPIDGPWVTAAFNNTGGNKMDSFVSSSLTYEVTGSCGQGKVPGSLTATLDLAQIPAGLPEYITIRNDDRDAPYGTTSMWVHLYGPVGADFRDFTVNGVSSPVSSGWERGHQVWYTKVELRPGQPVTITATFDQPYYEGQDLQVVPQPMVQPTTVTVQDNRQC